MTNTKAYATLVTEHIFSGYVLFYLFSLSVFHVISVNIVNVIFCKKCITIQNLKSESNTIAATFSQGVMGRLDVIPLILNSDRLYIAFNN